VFFVWCWIRMRKERKALPVHRLLAATQNRARIQERAKHSA
jgi:hypothetical protein